MVCSRVMRGIDYCIVPMSEFKRKCPPVPERKGLHLCPPDLSEPLLSDQPAGNIPHVNLYMRKQQTIKHETKPMPRCNKSFLLGDNTIAGKVWPMRFHVRRLKTNCKECDNELCLRETVTGNENIMLLSNCCTVQVYPKKQIDNLHRVPVGLITGKDKFTKKTLNEVLYDPCKKQEPKKPPPPPTPKVSIARVSKRRKSKKKKKRKSEKRLTKTITTKKIRREHVHEYEIHHSKEEVKERMLREQEANQKKMSAF